MQKKNPSLWTPADYQSFEKLANAVQAYKPPGHPYCASWPMQWESDPLFSDFRALRDELLAHPIARQLKAQAGYRAACKKFMVEFLSYHNPFADVRFLTIVADRVNDYYLSKARDPSHVTANKKLREKQVKTAKTALALCGQGAVLIDWDEQRAGQKYLEKVLSELSGSAERIHSRETYLQRQFTTSVAVLLQLHFAVDSAAIIRDLSRIIGYAPKAQTTLARHAVKGREKIVTAVHALYPGLPVASIIEKKKKKRSLHK